MISYPLYPQRHVQQLDGIWDFAWLGENAPRLETFVETLDSITFTEFAAVPGCFDVAPKYAGKRGVGAYRLKITVSHDGELLLKTGGNGVRTAIFWDGVLVEVDELPYSARYWKLPSISKKSDGTVQAPKIHELLILADNRFNFADSPLFNPFYDFYAYGGIYRSLELHILPSEAYFERAEIRITNLRAGRVSVTAHMNGTVFATSVLKAGFDGANPTPVQANFKNGMFTFEATVPDARLWTCETPFLHTLELRCENDVIIERFGLRTVTCKDGSVLLNEKPVQLQGFNRHDTHPQFGHAVPPEIWIEDLQLLKDLGCNFIRGCHYPQNQAFLDLCDQCGFLVWEESLAWGDRETIQADEKFCRLQLEQTRLMVRNSINHPSIIMWGFMNEGGDKHEIGESLYRKLAAVIREEDLSRPLTFASMYPELGRCFDLPDIISLNVYPGWYESENWTDERPLHRIAERFDQLVALFSKPEYVKKPLIISEIGAGGIYGWRDRVQTLWSEEYQTAYLDEVCKCVQERKRIGGLALWQFCDSRTYAAGGVLMRPRAFNNKGIVDEYRRPKIAYEAVKQWFSGKKN